MNSYSPLKTLLHSLQRSCGGRPAGVEGEVGDRLDQLGFRQAVADGKLQMIRQVQRRTYDYSAPALAVFTQCLKKAALMMQQYNRG